MLAIAFEIHIWLNGYHKDWVMELYQLLNILHNLARNNNFVMKFEKNNQEKCVKIE